MDVEETEGIQIWFSEYHCEQYLSELSDTLDLNPLHSGFGENKELRKVIVRFSFVLYPGQMFIYVFSLKVMFDKCHVLTGFVLSFSL